MSVGSALAAARQARGLSVDDVSAATRIRPHLIRAIEAEDFAACGGDVYARGHVRALAKAVGLDPEPLVAELAAATRPVGSTLRAPASDASLVLRERRAAPRWVTAAAVALGVLVCLAGLRMLLPEDSGKVETKAAGPRVTTAAARPTVKPSTVPAESYRDGTVTVSFQITGRRCWIGVTDSAGATQAASVLSRGQTATFRDDRKLSVIVGDVNAVAVRVNGQEVPLRGARGGVKRFVVRASDPLAGFRDTRSGNARSRPGA